LVDQIRCRLRRIQSLPPEEEVRNNSPPPLLRHHLDQAGDFVSIGLVEISTIEPSELNASEPEVLIVEYLRAEECTLTFNPPLTKKFHHLWYKFYLLDQTLLIVSLFVGPLWIKLHKCLGQESLQLPLRQ